MTREISVRRVMS